MRPLKEIAFLLLIAALGVALGGWCTEIFGAKVTGDILKYGGAVSGIFFAVIKTLNTATALAEKLGKFDEITRQEYEHGLALFRQRFKRRMIIGLALAAISTGAGLILGKWETKDTLSLLIISCAGGGALAAGTIMATAQLLASFWPAEYVAGAEKIARIEKERLERVARYSDTEPRLIE